MLFTVEQREILRKTTNPHFEQVLEEQLQAMLKDLPWLAVDKVQVAQGRCLQMQDLLAELKASTETPANRKAKPQL